MADLVGFEPTTPAIRQHLMAAAKLVEQLSKLHTVTPFAERGDFDLMHELTGWYWDLLEVDPMHYGGFCRTFSMAVEADFVPPVTAPAWRCWPRRSCGGVTPAACRGWTGYPRKGCGGQTSASKESAIIWAATGLF